MNQSEIRKLVSESPHTEWLNELNATFNFHYLNERKRVKGFSNIFKLVSTEREKWSKVKDGVPNELKASYTYYDNIYKQILSFAKSYIPNERHTAGHLMSGWKNILGQIKNVNSNPLPIDHPKTAFLISVHENQPLRFLGAFKYITNTLSGSITNKEYFTGVLMSYEFENQNISEITSRKNNEKRSISQIRTKFETQLQNSEQDLISHLSKYNESYKIKSDEIQAFKTEKEVLFNNWFTASKDEFRSLDSRARKSIEELEKTYEEMLRLKKPAEYWKKRAVKLNKEGWYATISMICLIVLASLTLYILLILAPEGMLKSFAKDTSSAIKWSIVYIMFISLMVYGIRVTHRIAFSSFHLARDAEEREQLTHVYLAMIKDNEISQEEKNLIIQSLFSRADTGLLKEDSSPTMPNDLIGKLINRT